MQNFVGKTKCIVGYMKVANCVLFQSLTSYNNNNNNNNNNIIIIIIVEMNFSLLLFYKN